MLIAASDKELSCSGSNVMVFSACTQNSIEVSAPNPLVGSWGQDLGFACVPGCCFSSRPVELLDPLMLRFLSVECKPSTPSANKTLWGQAYPVLDHNDGRIFLPSTST